MYVSLNTPELIVPCCRDSCLDRATKVFLTTDLVNQQYLAYLATNRSQLFLMRLEKTNAEQEIIFGKITSIYAKDAVNLTVSVTPSLIIHVFNIFYLKYRLLLQKLNMIAVMDSSGITLYSGPMYVGKVHIPNLMTNYGLGIARSVSSPFPRRSSYAPTLSSPRDIIKFESDVHLLSPVGIPSNHSANFMDNSLVEGLLTGLKDAVGYKLTLDYGNQSYYRVALPSLCTSPLGMLFNLTI